MSSNFWTQRYRTLYSKKEWYSEPNLFAKTARSFFPEQGKVLCLGDGQGADGRYFASERYCVCSTDLCEDVVAYNKECSAEMDAKDYETQVVDLCKPLPFEAGSFDVVYAHLSLHYFSTTETERIFSDIYKILKPNGLCCALVNSVNDPEFNVGERLEQELFEIRDTKKRYFSVFSMEHFAKDFKVELLDDQGCSYKDDEMDVRNLVRFIGRK